LVTFRDQAQYLKYSLGLERTTYSMEDQVRPSSDSRDGETHPSKPVLLEALIEAASDGIVVVDVEGCIVLANERVGEMLAYDRDELLGQQVELLLPRRFSDVHISHRHRYSEHPFARPMGMGLDLVGRRQDGSEFPVEVSLSHVETAEGGYVLAVISDITERIQAEQTLKQHVLELQARNDELDAFAHTVAHDLKNPLARMIGFAEILQEDAASLSIEDLRHLLGIISRTGRKMNNIVDELLMLASVRQIEHLELSPVDMATVVAETLDRLADMIIESRAEMIVPDHWPVALGHGPWVEEVWVNYVSNAIKYGGHPPRVELGASEQANGTVRYWVRDNGPGLTPEEQKRLFTAFERLHRVQAEGHGLGLSIARRIVDKLGGHVDVQSEIGQGSTFSFSLPKAP
jgi:PAS domain S-box-containing protein